MPFKGGGHLMIIPEAMLFQIRVEVFSRSEHLLPSHKVPRCIGKVSSETIHPKSAGLLSPMNRGERRGRILHFFQMSHNGGSRITLTMHCRERTAANFCVDSCLGP